MKRFVRIKFLSKLLIGLFVVSVVNGCTVPRTGEYFISMREAGRSWGNAGSYWGEPMGYAKAGIVSFPTVIGPLYYWFVRPVYDTVDWFVISPTVDIVCLPVDFYLRTWRRVKLHIVDENGEPCAGVKMRLPSGNVQTSDEEGNMDFITWREYDGEHSPKLLNEEYYQKSYIAFQMARETIGKRSVPVAKVQEIQLRRKQKLSPYTDGNIMTIVPAHNKPIPFDLFAKDWVVPYGTGTETNLIIELKYDNQDKRTDISLTIPDGKDGGFCPFIRVQGEDSGLYEWQKWGQNKMIEKSLSFVYSMGVYNHAFCISPKTNNGSTDDNIYGVIRSIGVPWDLQGLGVPLFFFRYRLNARGADWFEWADSNAKEQELMFRIGNIDVCDTGEFRLKDACGNDIWIKMQKNGRFTHSYEKPRVGNEN